tara:strand:- start:57628 stop:58401 length:774 start_codon:yes stop_codon:yes gene_type:complete
MGRVVFLSPHLDDAIFSCAGRIQQCVDQGDDVEIVTVFSEGNRDRINEDFKATRILGCTQRLLGFEDAPIRRGSSDVLFQNISEEAQTIKQLIDELRRLKNEIPKAVKIYSPLGIGWHIDHLITFEAAIKTFSDFDLEFYEDSPYKTVLNQTEIRIGSYSDSQKTLFIQDFFNAKYVKTYLSHWTYQLLTQKLTEYSDLVLPVTVHPSRKVILSPSMSEQAHVAKTQYTSQSVFYDSLSQGNIELYYKCCASGQTQP